MKIAAVYKLDASLVASDPNLLQSSLTFHSVKSGQGADGTA